MLFSASPISRKSYVAIALASSRQLIINDPLRIQCTDCDYDGREDNDAFYGVSVAEMTLNPTIWTPVTPYPCDQPPSEPLTDRPASPGYPQFDPIDREGLDSPQVSTNKEGEYCCKKHGSPSAFMSRFSQTPRISCDAPLLHSLQSMLRLEKTDQQSSHRSQEGRPKVVMMYRSPIQALYYETMKRMSMYVYQKTVIPV
jgi:hypothetical protein